MTFEVQRYGHCYWLSFYLLWKFVNRRESNFTSIYKKNAFQSNEVFINSLQYKNGNITIFVLALSLEMNKINENGNFRIHNSKTHWCWIFANPIWFKSRRKLQIYSNTKLALITLLPLLPMLCILWKPRLAYHLCSTKITKCFTTNRKLIPFNLDFDIQMTLTFYASLNGLQAHRFKIIDVIS